MMTLLIGLGIVLFAVLLDQGSKQLMLHILSDLPNQTIEVIPNFFRFALRFNTGAAFSSFDGDFWLLMGMTVVATIIFIFIAKPPPLCYNAANIGIHGWYPTLQLHLWI